MAQAKPIDLTSWTLERRYELWAQLVSDSKPSETNLLVEGVDRGPCLIYPKTNQFGYARAGFGSEVEDGRLLLVYRLTVAIGDGFCAADYQVDHECHNRACIEPKHLTKRSDANHRAEEAKRGRRRFPRQRKLVRAQVEQIWIRLNQGESTLKLGEEFGVTANMISAIKNGWCWNSVTGLPKRSKPKPKKG